MTRQQDDPIYAEFDDVDMRRWPYVASVKARDAIKALATEYRLGFQFNPGGGEFNAADPRSPLYGFHLQITTNDDVLDLNTLRTAISARLVMVVTRGEWRCHECGEQLGGMLNPNDGTWRLFVAPGCRHADECRSRMAQMI